MIHVDVKRVPQGEVFGYVVQTSVDGGRWTTQYIIPFTVGDNDAQLKRDAESTARAFVSGARFAGAEVRATSCGYHFC